MLGPFRSFKIPMNIPAWHHAAALWGTVGGGHEAGGQHLFESLRRRPRLKNPITEDGQNAPGTVTNWQQV